ncbi:MAG TPA: preprotein translocase subunit SecG [Clostridiales bacterium]|nr:MAG: preprotein translocase subunit SecG [Clostridiales bacterium GWD2_32_59]HAN09419.1 preprotein translocase subunit SecG [Clostridiales bacterium]
MTTILYGVYLLITVFLIIIILMQKSKTRGFGVMTGTTSVGDTYYNKNKSKTYEGKLESLTKIGIFVFIILAVVINVIINNQETTNTKTGVNTNTTEGVIPKDIADEPYGLPKEQQTGTADTATSTTPTTETTTTPITNTTLPVAPTTTVPAVTPEEQTTKTTQQ